VTKSKQNGWRLGGRNAPKWLLAPCIPAVKQRTREDLELLKAVFRIEQLEASHPLYELWHRTHDATALAEARYDLHHLADDVRVVRDVPGGKQLLNTMVSDAEGFDDFRYELRIAGCVGRRPGQSLVAVGGTAKGPDVQVKTLSGHLCGIACYRGRTWTTLLADEAPVVLAKLAARCSAICTQHVFAPLRRVKMALTFERFPISADVVEAAVAAFDEVWNRPEGEPTATRDGVSVGREAVDNGVTETWEVTIAFRLPVPERERFRLTNTVREKLEKEERQWAGAYTGVPVLCAEESDFCLGFEKEPFEKVLLEETAHSMQGILTSWQFFTDGFVRGSRTRVEQYEWHARPTSTNLNLGIHTFGENMDSYSDGFVVLTMNPKHADEEWRVIGVEGAGAIATCTRPLTIERRMTRSRALPPGQLYTEADILPMVKAVRGEEGHARIVTGSQRRRR
jgi:hypothetical protein